MEVKIYPPSLLHGSSWALILCLLGLSPVRAEGAFPEPDHVVPVWYLGMPVMSRSFEASNQPIMQIDQIPDDLPFRQVIAYIVGVADMAIGASPAQTIHMPDGTTIVIPEHQAVTSCLSPPDDPALGVAYSVIPGPNASRYNLRADPMPEQSVVGDPLAIAIKIGPSWIPLTSHEVIKFGLYKGLVQLRFFGANPVGWSTPDWQDNYPFMPEMVRECNEPARADIRFLAPTDPAKIVPPH